ncbi:MAG TPA: OsmC family protein [archaeon]|nr:OsmC family protein [archaeon]
MSRSEIPVSVKLHHSEALKFDVDVDGRKLELNSSDVMGQAFTPMELFLVALAGCTAMDVQWIMNRQRQKSDKFDMSVSGVRRREDPRSYESIDIRYNFAGHGMRKDAIERAIRLSLDKYCSVRAMVNDSVKLNITYAISSGAQPETAYTYGS